MAYRTLLGAIPIAGCARSTVWRYVGRRRGQTTLAWNSTLVVYRDAAAMPCSRRGPSAGRAGRLVQDGPLDVRAVDSAFVWLLSAKPRVHTRSRYRSVFASRCAHVVALLAITEAVPSIADRPGAAEGRQDAADSGARFRSYARRVSRRALVFGRADYCPGHSNIDGARSPARRKPGVRRWSRPIAYIWFNGRNRLHACRPRDRLNWCNGLRYFLTRSHRAIGYIGVGDDVSARVGAASSRGGPRAGIRGAVCAIERERVSIIHFVPSLWRNSSTTRALRHAAPPASRVRW